VTFNQYISTALILQRNEDKVTGNIGANNRSENNKEMRLEKLVCAVAAKLHTTIDVSSCFS